MTYKDKTELVRDPDVSDGLELGIGPAKIRLTGHIVKQVVIGATVIGGFWYLGYTEPQAILHEVRSLRGEVVKTQVMTQAIVEALPTKQQQQAQKMIRDRMAVLQLASARP